MFDLLDLWLLRRGIPSDDRSLSFRRIDGNPNAKAIYFLPWHTSFYVARSAGFVGVDFLACYEMPPAIVSSIPELSVEALRRLVRDAEALLAGAGTRAKDALIVGLSIGTYPAVFLANRIGAAVCAVAAADRGDLMLWQSPAGRLIKRRALQRGIELAHYSEAMRGYHPVQNLEGIAPRSLFVMGARDPFIPARRRRGLLRALRRHAPHARVITLSAGHVKTMIASARYQHEMVGIEQQWGWNLRMPLPALMRSSA